MNAELENDLDQLRSIVQDVPGIVAHLSDGQFNWQPAPDGWSIAQCFSHLNATAGRFVGPIEQAIGEARSRGWTSAGPFAYPLLERAFARFMEPPPRVRIRARAGFQPARSGRVAEVMDDFYRWQERLRELLCAADGVDLRRTRLASPVLPVFRYSLGICFVATLAHQRRHVWQAREVRNHPAFPRT